jgi:hypothetical protein
MKKFDEIKFDLEDTNAIISEKISARVLEVSLEEVTEELSKNFIFQEESIKVLYTSIATGQNVILFGPGGFSKSKLVVSFFELLGIPLTFKVGHEECTTEELLGIPNLQKLLNESKIETAFENSIFCKPSVLVLEEGLDIPPTVAACLKDIISQRGLREGNIFKESKISNIIIIGNKSPQDLNYSDTLKAFYNERFPLQHLMVWKDFSAESYYKFFEIYFKEKIEGKENEFLLLSELCANTKTIVSPRIAAAGGDVILKLNINYLDTVSGIDTSKIDIYKTQTKLKSKLLIENGIFKVIRERLSVINSSNNFEGNLYELILVRNLLNKFEFSNTNSKVVDQLLISVEEHSSKLMYSLDIKYKNIKSLYPDVPS